MNESLGRGKKGGDCRLNRKKNKEGYIDTTAYYGLQSQMREDADLEKAVHCLIHVIRNQAELAGFQIENRIVFRHRKTGKVFR